MISVPPERIRERIKEHSKLSDKQIDAKVEEKLASLSGLISRDGALHIIANELGVKILPEKGEIRVKDILAGMQLSINLRVLKVYELREFNRDGKAGKVSSFFAGDETGVLRVTLWHEHAPLIEKIKEGSIVSIKDGSVRENQGRLEVHLNNNSKMIIDPAGVVVNVNNANVQERSYSQKKISELSTGDEFVDILGTIVQVFDPRTFEKKTGGQGMVCNAVVDDGTGSIRASFWDDDCKSLLGDAATNAELMPDAKIELLGQIVKIQGRCKLNPTYNTLELSVSRMERNPDPAGEMSRVS